MDDARETLVAAAERAGVPLIRLSRMIGRNDAYLQQFVKRGTPRRLPEREQLVLSLYYEQELNLKEIGAVLGVSESRVCQIHGQAMLRLRGRLKIFESADAGLDEP